MEAPLKSPKPVLAAGEKQSLEAAWEAACVAFEQAAKIDLKTAQAPHSDAIRSTFDNARTKDAEQHRKKEKAKDIFFQTLTLVGRVGSIAASGAAMVFGAPATVASSALTFLIDAGLQYRNMMAEIEDLLTQIVEVFERSQIYRDNEEHLPPEIVRVAHKLLIAVVEICGVCYKVLSEGRLGHFGRFGRITFFGPDSKVQAQLDRLKRIEAEESKTQSTLTLVMVAENKKVQAAGFEKTNRNVDKISDSVQHVQNTLKEDKDLKDLRKELPALKDANYKEQFFRYFNKLSEDSGGDFCTWLKEDTVYQSWANIDGQQQNILMLSGEQGFGKTFTATAIINDLHERYPQIHDESKRVSIAYYYLNRFAKTDTKNEARNEPKNDTKNEAKSEASVTLPDILRLLAWQLAQTDLIYRRDIISACRARQLGTSQELWKNLFLDRAAGAVFLLVVDGIDELDEKELETFAQLVEILGTQASTYAGIKLLLTSRSDSVEELDEKLSTPANEIKLITRTKPDLTNYVNREMRKMSIFKRQSERVQSLMEFVRDGLIEAVGGSFVNASLLLREVNGKNDEQEVREFIERAKKGDALSGSIAEIVRRCNQNLRSKELQDLNTLLLWVMYGEWPFDVGECEAILSLQAQDSPLKLLEDQIKTAYRELLKLDSYGNVYLENSNIDTYFKSLSSEQDSVTGTATKKASEGEILLVKNFVLTFCKEEIYNRIGLDAFFDKKLSESNISVTVDCDNAHALILIGCLRTLTGHCPEEAKRLYNYCGYYAMSHLKNLDLDCINPQYKGEIGPLLVELLRDPDFAAKASQNYWFPEWAYDDAILTDILRLFRSSAVMKKVMSTPGEAKDWVSGIQNSSDSSQAALDLFAPMASAAIRHWVGCKDNWENERIFMWIFGYYTKVRHTKDPDYERADSQPSNEDIKPSTIQQIFEWAQNQVAFDAHAVETIRNLGITYREKGKLDEAIETLERAAALDEGHVLLQVNLATAYGMRSEDQQTGEWEKAIRCASRVIDATSKGQHVIEEGDAPEYQVMFQRDSARWYRNLKSWDEAENLFTQLLEKDPQDYETINERIILLHETERWADVVELIHGLENQTHEAAADEQPSKTPPRTRFIAFLNSFGNDEDVRFRIVNAFKKADQLPRVKQHYQKAVADIEKPIGRHTDISLYQYGRTVLSLAALHHSHAAEPEEEEQAIRLWENLVAFECQTSDQANGLMYAKHFSGRYLLSGYLTRATRVRSDALNAEEMVVKMKALGESDDDEDSGSWHVSKDTVRSMIGRYFTAMGDGAQAREWLKPNVEMGIKLLQDTDVTNDYQGYRKLGDAFMDFGDLENAVASWCMIGPEEKSDSKDGSAQDVTKKTDDPVNGVTTALDTQATTTLQDDAAATSANSNIATDGGTKSDSEDTKEEPERPHLRKTKTWRAEKELSGPLTYTCDGRCGKNWTYSDDIHVCRECIDVQFDTKCLEKLKAGELGRDVCSKEHHFMYIPAWDHSRQERIRAERVMVGDKEMSMREWLDGIQKDWGITVAE